MQSETASNQARTATKIGKCVKNFRFVYLLNDLGFLYVGLFTYAGVDYQNMA